MRWVNNNPVNNANFVTDVIGVLSLHSLLGLDNGVPPRGKLGAPRELGNLSSDVFHRPRRVETMNTRSVHSPSEQAAAKTPRSTQTRRRRSHRAKINRMTRRTLRRKERRTLYRQWIRSLHSCNQASRSCRIVKPFRRGERRDAVKYSRRTPPQIVYACLSTNACLSTKQENQRGINTHVH